MRSIQKGSLSSEEDGASQDSLPQMNTESESPNSSLSKFSLTEEYPFKSISEIHTWQLKDPEIWSATSLVSEDQDAQVQAWSIQSWNPQFMGSKLKGDSLLELEDAPTPKHKISSLKIEVTKKEQKKNIPRPLWSNKVEYTLAQVTWSVRLGSLWSLSYLWFAGGGVFFIVYILMMLLIGVPLLFVEMVSGQRLYQGGLGAWKLISPWMTGLGYTSFMVCFIQGLLLNVLNCWSLPYLSRYFQFPLPWDKCPLVKNSSEFDAECARTTPSTYFWYRETLKISDTIEDYGPVNPLISLHSFLLWCLTGVIMINGVKSVGKVIYALAVLSCLICFCLFTRCLLLDGASFGLKHLFVFKIANIYSWKIWYLAVIQVLYGLGLGFGVFASSSSYMPSSNNCLIDAFVVILGNLGITLIITPVIASVLSFWATVTTRRCSERSAEELVNLVYLGELPPVARPPENVLAKAASMFVSWLHSLPPSVKNMVLSKVSECNIDDQFLQVQEGSTFVFLAFIEAMSFIPGSTLWSILFFLMYLAIGLSTAVGALQGIVTPLQDTFSFFREQPKLLIGSVPMVMFLCSLFFAHPTGYYFFLLINDFWIPIPIILVIILENLTVAWVYGIKRFLTDMMLLMEHLVSPICRFLLCCLCPFVLLTVFVITMKYIHVEDFEYLAWNSSTSQVTSQQFPAWAQSSVIIFNVIVLLPILVYFVHSLIYRIPFSSSIFNMPVIVSKSLNLRSRLKSDKDFPNE